MQPEDVKPENTNQQNEATDNPTEGEQSAVTQPETSPEPATSPEGETVDQDPPAVTVSHHARSKRPWKWIIIVLVVLLLAGGGFWFWRSQHKTATTPPASTAQQKPKVQASITFLDSPKQLPDLNFFANFNTYFPLDCVDLPACTKYKPKTTASDIHYYQIATLQNGNKVIVVGVPVEGPVVGGYDYLLAQQTGANTYAFLAKQSNLVGQYSTAAQLADFQKTLNTSVTVDLNTEIAELQFPNTLSVKDVTLSTRSSGTVYGYFMKDGLAGIRGTSFGEIAKGSQPVKVGQSQGKDVYQVTALDSTYYTAKEWYATINKVYASSYEIADSINSVYNQSTQKTPPTPISWTSGQNNVSVYRNLFVSCGTSGYLVPKNVTKGQVVQVGTGPNNTPVYAFPNNSPLLNEIYTNDYKPQSQYIEDTSLRNLTLQQFQDDHAVIVSINSYGELVVHVRGELFLGGGCGKPVIYLYPTKATNVNVKVGAQVVKSDPFYPGQTGWLNVLAQPSGSLTYQGKPYSSLFWEGYGQGRYPAITSGTVVPSGQAAATIRSQLISQGLKTSEINDFLAFWQPRLPSTPYVRLTWFGTGVMQQIAPLNISPRPDTLIRVFLDFEGLNQPVSMPTQHFSATARSGFTVVEWGGLLRGGF